MLVNIYERVRSPITKDRKTEYKLVYIGNGIITEIISKRSDMHARESNIKYVLFEILINSTVKYFISSANYLQSSNIDLVKYTRERLKSGILLGNYNPSVDKDSIFVKKIFEYFKDENPKLISHKRYILELK